MATQNPAKRKAVLTADVVGSRHIPAKVLEARMAAIARMLEAQVGQGEKLFEFYRGDSFQAIIGAEDALKVALLWRAALKATEGPYTWDIRIAIGLGEISHLGTSLAVSGGTAFQYSGTLLDQMKQDDDARIRFHTDDESWTAALHTECLLAEGLISRWTATGAETVFNLLYYGDTQDALATRMGVSQPAIHERLQAANWAAIRHWEQFYRQTITQRTKATEIK